MERSSRLNAYRHLALKLRTALHNQRDQLLSFAGVLDQKLAAIATHFELPLEAVREVCLLHRKPPTSDAY